MPAHPARPRTRTTIPVLMKNNQELERKLKIELEKQNKRLIHNKKKRERRGKAIYRKGKMWKKGGKVENKK
jgi:hypothetical protein